MFIKTLLIELMYLHFTYNLSYLPLYL